MITGLILKFFGFVLHAVLSVLPTISVPSWLTSADGAITTVFQAAGSMSVWFPIALASTVLLAVLAIWAVAFGIKAARIVVSLFTGGGGGAA